MVAIGAFAKKAARFDFGRLIEEFFLKRLDLLQDHAVGQLWHRNAGDLVRQNGDRHEVGNDQDRVLGDLCPGDGPHAAKE